MGTENPLHRAHRKEVFWKHHVESWAQTTLTQTKYCKDNNLSPSDFSKWKKKLGKTRKKIVSSVGTKKGLSGDYETTKKLYAHRCGFCSRAEKNVSRLFSGTNEFVNICDYCLWRKAHVLHFEVKEYKKTRFEKCNVCMESKSGNLIGSIYYKVCSDCLVHAWKDLYKQYPDKHPCHKVCIRCKEKEPEEYIQFENHVICNPCLLFILKKYIKVDVDPNSCSFCKKERSIENRCYGVGTRWICESCAKKALDFIIEGAAAPILMKCNFCGIQKRKGISFVEGEKASICENCVSDAQDLLSSSSKE